MMHFRLSASEHPAHPQQEPHDQCDRYSDAENHERDATDEADQNEELADDTAGARERAKQREARE